MDLHGTCGDAIHIPRDTKTNSPCLLPTRDLDHWFPTLNNADILRLQLSETLASGGVCLPELQSKDTQVTYPRLGTTDLDRKKEFIRQKYMAAITLFCYTFKGQCNIQLPLVGNSGVTLSILAGMDAYPLSWCVPKNPIGDSLTARQKLLCSTLFASCMCNKAIGFQPTFANTVFVVFGITTLLKQAGTAFLREEGYSVVLNVGPALCFVTIGFSCICFRTFWSCLFCNKLQMVAEKNIFNRSKLLEFNLQNG